MIKDNIFLIQEETSQGHISLLSEGQILEANIPSLTDNIRKGRKGGLVFETRLQDTGHVNGNKRIYNKKALGEAILAESGSIGNGTFFGEMDHPITSDPRRFQQVLIKESCYRVLKTEWKGNELFGVCETLSNSLGKDMRALIEDNGIMLGFSLRAIGKTQLNPSTGITEVQSPMKVFCYDLVSNPSHSSARMTKVLSESEVYQATDGQYNQIMESNGNLQAISESYGFDCEELYRQGNLYVDPNNGLLISKMDNTVAKMFLKEDILNSFVQAKRNYFLV